MVRNGPDITKSPLPKRRKVSKSSKTLKNDPKTPKLGQESPKNAPEKTDSSPGCKFVCKICRVCMRTQDLIEKHCLENHGKVKMYARVTKRKKSFRAKKSLIVDQYEEDLKKLTMWYCAYCEFEDKSQNGLKTHLSQKNTHDTEDLYDRSRNVFGENNIPFKCIVCFARFLTSDLLRIHIGSHTGRELLDRCIDFSSTMYEDREEEPEAKPDIIPKAKKNTGIIMAKPGVVAKKSTNFGGMAFSNMAAMEAYLKANPNLIETDSESDDEDTPLSQLSTESCDIINFSFEVERSPGKYPKPILLPGVKCFLCEIVLDGEDERSKHLAEFHQIEANADMVSFAFRTARRTEQIDLLAVTKQNLVEPILQNGNKTMPKSVNAPKTVNAPKSASGSKSVNGPKGGSKRAMLKCEYCDRTFQSYDHEDFNDHKKAHQETFETPFNFGVPADWLQTNNNTQSNHETLPEIPF